MNKVTQNTNQIKNTGGMSMNQLEIFKNKEFGEVRIIMVDGKPMFAGRDIAKALGYANTNEAISRHCKGIAKHEGVSITVNQYGQETKQLNEMAFIPEGDVYRLIVKSKLPSAEKFELWLFDEVIPEIRQTGSYVVDSDNARINTARKIAGKISDPEVLNYIKDLFGEMAELSKANETLSLQVKEDRPKVEAYEKFLDTDGYMDFATFAKVSNIGMGRNTLMAKLRAHKILDKNNIPYQSFIDRGYFVVKAVVKNGYNYNVTLLEKKGIDWLLKHFSK